MIRHQLTAPRLLVALSAQSCTPGRSAIAANMGVYRILKKKSSVYDCTVEDVEYIYNKFSLYNVSVVTHSRHLVVAITFP